MIDFTIFHHPEVKADKTKFIFRAFIWKINQFFIREPMITHLTEKIRIICYPDSSYAGSIFLTRLPEVYEMSFMLRNLTEKSLFVDIGANIGTYSLLAGSQISKGKIFAFEVDRNALSRFYENILINNLSGLIKVEEKLASDKNGYEYFINETASEMNHIRRNTEHGSGNKIKSITFDKYFSDKKIKNIDIVKIDVEGAELKVLEGMKDYLKKKRIKILILEINEQIGKYGGSPAEVISLLERLGYKGFKFERDGRRIRIEKEDKNLVNTRNFIFLSGSRV